MHTTIHCISNWIEICKKVLKANLFFCQAFSQNSGYVGSPAAQLTITKTLFSSGAKYSCGCWQRGDSFNISLSMYNVLTMARVLEYADHTEVAVWVGVSYKVTSSRSRRMRYGRRGGREHRGKGDTELTSHKWMRSVTSKSFKNTRLTRSTGLLCWSGWLGWMDWLGWQRQALGPVF